MGAHPPALVVYLLASMAMQSSLSLSLLAAALLTTRALITSASSAPPYTPTWPSVCTHGYPQWFSDAKFGIYAHFGPYSVPAFGSEWYSRNMYQIGSAEYKHHLATYGSLNNFGYKDFIPRFTTPNFNASEWASLYRRAGAQYSGPVAEHADGFAMFKSNVSHYNAFEMGPKRDIVGEMEVAVREQGMRFIATLHHQWLWAWYPTFNTSLDHDAGSQDYQLTPAHGGLYGPAVPNPASFNPPCGTTQAFQDYFLAKTLEVVDQYHPDIVYFDSKWANTIDEAHRLAFLAHYYNAAAAWGTDVVVTYKDSDLKVGAGLLDLERGGSAGILVPAWQTDDAMDRHSWSWVEPPSLKNSSELVGELCDIVSKGGNFLLDIPPMADGTIPEVVQDILLSIGDWLALNGAAIYATVPWRMFGEGPTVIVPGFGHEWPMFTPRDFRFTAAKDGSAVFLLAMAHGPVGTTYKIASLNSTALPAVTNVSLIGSATPVTWTQDASGLHVGAIADYPVQDTNLPMAFRIHLGGATSAHIDLPSQPARDNIHRL